jgi:hypothetical protein
MSAFGDALARLMTERGVPVRELARKSHYSAGYISNLRSGAKRPSADCAAELDELLDGGGKLTALAAVPAQEDPAAPEPPWQPRHLGGAAPLNDDVNPVAHLLAFRDQITDSDSLFGPRRLIPLVRAHIGLIRQLRRGITGADSRELLRVQARYAETLAWQYQDITRFRDAQYWLDRALEWAHMAGDMEWAAFVLARKSQLAGDMHDPAAAVDLAEAAARLAGAGRLLAASAAYQAHGHALTGDEAASLDALDEAREIVAAPDPDPSASWSPWLSPEYVEAQRARCLTLLGRHDQAVTWYGRAIDGTPAELRRERGVHLARKALAHAGAGAPDAAAETGTAALAILQLTGSGRISTDLKRLDVSLRQWPVQQSVAGFREQLAASMPRP